MDLQCVLVAPSLNASAFYYKTKLAVHNFTIYYLATRDVRCYVWDESEGGLSSNEFSSCLTHYLRLRVSDFNHFIIYSDWCNYQNRNAILASAMSLTSQLWRNSSPRMEVDSVHGTIERSLKNALIYIPMDYVNIMLKARRIPKPIAVFFFFYFL